MQYFQTVDVVHRKRDLSEIVEHQILPQRASISFLNQFFHRSAVGVFHDDVQLLHFNEGCVEMDDVGMHELAKQSSLCLNLSKFIKALINPVMFTKVHINIFKSLTQNLEIQVRQKLSLSKRI